MLLSPSSPLQWRPTRSRATAAVSFAAEYKRKRRLRSKYTLSARARTGARHEGLRGRGVGTAARRGAVAITRRRGQPASGVFGSRSAYLRANQRLISCPPSPRRLWICLGHQWKSMVERMRSGRIGHAAVAIMELVDSQAECEVNNVS